MKNKKSIISTVITVACITIAVNLFTPKSTLSDKDLEKEIKRVNKEELPMPLDEFMRLDSIKILSPKVLTYYVTANILKEEAEDDAMREYLHPNILANIKNNKTLEVYRNSNITWNYRFNDSIGVFFHEYTVTPQMYK